MRTVNNGCKEIEKAFGMVELQSKDDGLTVILRTDVVLKFLVLLNACCGFCACFEGGGYCGVSPEC